MAKTRECVLGIPSVELAKQVAAPLIAGCYANLECRVADSRMVNKCNFFVPEAVKAWTAPQ